MSLACLIPLCLPGIVSAAPLDSSAAVKAIFAAPPREFATAPLWVWNDFITEEEVTQTMEALAAQKIMQAFVHPRPGLMTPYMSEDWWRLWRHTLEEAERLDMNVWIYDENSYPSGFAGGFVPEAMPEARARGISMKRAKAPEAWSDDLLAVFRQENGQYRQVTADLKAGKKLRDGDYLLVSIELTKSSPWFGGQFYVDLLDRKVTEKFLDVTLEAYRRESGGRFSERTPGSFTDEPHLASAGQFHWTPGLPDLFKARWGYDLMENLPSLVEKVGEWQKVRHNYQQLVLDLFIDNFMKPYYDYCARNNIEFTGHVWEHEWPNPKYGPDNMAMSAWQQRPGIDMLFNDPYNFGPHAQVGNTRAIVEVASVANQMGRARTLCEAYGGSGWDMRFEDMKRIGDWLCVLGINTMDQHLSHMTLRGARKRDYPPTFSYHEPWWDVYGASAQYFTRVCMAISQGQQVNKILVIEPTTTSWAYHGEREIQEELGTKFQTLVADLLAAQVEFDLGSESVVAHSGQVSGKGFQVGERTYDVVVLPAKMENINSTTLELLEAFGEAGGRILACEVPALVDGKVSERPLGLAKMGGWSHVTQENMAEALRAKPGDAFLIARPQDDKALLFHQRRVLNDGEILFLVNTSPDMATSGAIEAAGAQGIEEWDLETGSIYGYPSTAAGTGVKAEFSLAPAGSLMLFLSKSAVNATPRAVPGGKAIDAVGDMVITRTEPNVLTIDYCDIEAGGETKTAVPFKTAATFAFQKNGMDRDPWDHAVQFKDEFIKMEFPETSGFTVSYRFTIDGPVPTPLAFVMERPDLYTIECNGQPVSAQEGQWWLDRAFGKIDVSSSAKTGENIVTCKASPFTVFHEIEAAFVIGDFSLRAAERGFVIAPVAELKLGAWNEQGYPLYGHGVAYTRKFDVATPDGQYFVSLPAWYGSVAAVTVNGKPAGPIYHQPFACDVTPLVQKGENTVVVSVIGTLRNTLGPHHGKQRLGFASPGSWDKAPETGPAAGTEYDSVRYGLFEPFVLLNK